MAGEGGGGAGAHIDTVLCGKVQHANSFTRQQTYDGMLCIHGTRKIREGSMHWHMAHQFNSPSAPSIAGPYGQDITCRCKNDISIWLCQHGQNVAPSTCW